MNETHFPALFSPLNIGTVEVRNRIMQTAHSKRYSWAGADTQREIDYQVARARGGVGLIVTGSRAVHPTSGGSRATVGYLRDAMGMSTRLVDAVHEHGTKIFAQLGHAGSKAVSDANDDLRVLWGPSAAYSPVRGESVKEMELSDISELIDSFAKSAEIAALAGYDGIELHFSHGYLVHQFISPLNNHRQDEYGGNLEGRLRLPLEIVAAIRGAVGDEIALGVRLGITDFMTDGGLTLDAGIEGAQMLVGTDQVDYLSITAGGSSKGRMIAPSDLPDGWLIELAGSVKAACPSVPIFGVGGIKHPADAEKVILEGRADMVAMTRAIIADPELPNKAKLGLSEDIYHCIRGNQGCISQLDRRSSITCTVNPAAGRESLLGSGTSRPAERSKRWLVIGGGPAGMKAAEGLAERGHEVTLVEKSASLGGQVELIVRTPHRAEFGWITRDLFTHLSRLGVAIKLGVEVDERFVEEFTADGIVVATGAVADTSGVSSSATPTISKLDGADQSNVITAWEVIRSDERRYGKVVVLDDLGSRKTSGAVELLLEAGNDVELVTSHSSLFPLTTTTLDSGFILRRVLEQGMRYRINSWARQISDSSVTVFNTFTGFEEVLDGVDLVVLGTAPHANDGLYLALQGMHLNVHRVGDCVAPRKIDHAIYEGFMAGRELWTYHERSILEGSLEYVAPGAANAEMGSFHG